MPLLSVKNLSISFANQQAVQDISFQLFPKKITALVGQSGSGKSVTALAIVRILRKAEITGEVIFEGKNLLTLSQEELCQIRGRDIALVFQDPNSSLNPLHKIGKQIAEAVTIHNPKISAKNLQKRVLELLKIVELESFSTRLNDYPHQLSGGQKQRVMIAIAIANNPKILIADEPTTALDAFIQNEILNLILRLKNELGIVVLFITHNLQVVKKIADEVIVLNAGKIVEEGSVKEIFCAPKNDYTKLLISSSEIIEEQKIKAPAEEILSVKNLSVIHKIRKSFFGKEDFYANNNLNLALELGHNLGVIGESGSGKSTLALALCNLISFTGEVKFFGGKNWKENNFELRKDVQIIFQDPLSSLNPRMLVGDIIAEGLLIHGFGKARQEAYVGFDSAQPKVKKVEEIMKKLRLEPKIKNRYPHELSGGQRQRVAIARALILNPKILVLDESTSALDLLTQNEILKLLLEIQTEQKISYILISHDLSVVSQIADKIMVLKDGQIVETGEKLQIMLSPKNSYTKELIALQ